MRELARAELKRGIVTLELGAADDRLAEVLPVLRASYGVAREFVMRRRGAPACWTSQTWRCTP